MITKLVNWNETYSVGYELIDRQHMILVDMINDLYGAFKQGVANEIIQDILTKMIQYTDFHFKTEERFFDTYNYFDAAKHIAEHNSFVEKVITFSDDFNNGSVTISYDVMNFLRDWLINHIQESDKQFGAHFLDKNIVLQ